MDDLGLESIAFPSISTGAFGYPINKAAEVCAKAVCSYEPKNLKSAFMCIYFNDKEVEIYNSAFEKYLKL